MSTPTGKTRRGGKKTPGKDQEAAGSGETKQDAAGGVQDVVQESSAPNINPNQEILDTVRAMSQSFTEVATAVSNLSSRMQILEDRVQNVEDGESSQSQASVGSHQRQKVTKRTSKHKRQPRYSTLENMAKFRIIPQEEDSNKEDDGSNPDVDGDGVNDVPTLMDNIFKGKKAGKLFRDLKKSSEVASAKTVTITREERRCHVRINDFKLGKVAKAIKDILEFQEQEETEVRIQKVLSTSLKAHLRNVYSITHAQLAQMDVSDLLLIVAQETKVFNCVAFYNELRDSLKHIQIMDWKYVNAVTFEAFYHQQLNLMQSFQTMLSIMLVSNKTWCPRIDDKEYGLIRLFKTLNDGTYVKYVLGCMSTNKFDSMSEFFKEYSAVLLDHYQVTIAYRQLPMESTTMFQQKHEDYLKRRKELFSQQSNKPSLNSRVDSKPRVSQVSHLDTYDESGGNYNDEWDDNDGYVPNDDDLWDAPSETWRSSNLEVHDDKQVAMMTDVKPMSGNDAAVDGERRVNSDRSLSAMHSRPTGAQNSKTDKYGCLRKIMYGKCDKTDCPYNHNAKCLLDSASEMRDKIDAYLKSAGSSEQRDKQPTILRRDHFGDSRP